MGIHEILLPPFRAEQLRRATQSAKQRTTRETTAQLIAFQPAKGGSGASVTSFNVAGRLSGDLGKRVLLLEADVFSGVMHLLVFVTPRYDYVVVDLPEVVDDISEAVVSYARTTYVVTTPDLLYLQLTPRRVRQREARNVRPGTVI